MPVLNPISAPWNTVGRFDDYDLIAREGTVERARRMLSDAGLLPEKANE
jgi:hypothetical protein